MKSGRNQPLLLLARDGDGDLLQCVVKPRPRLAARRRLEDLRLLTNYAMDSENRLGVILVGHPELRRRLGMSALEALAQRIVVRAHVRGIARDEIGGYLEHRLRLAGCELPLFEPATVEAIHQASNGLPRKVNLLAHHARFAAAIAKAKTVTTEHVQTEDQIDEHLGIIDALPRLREGHPKVQFGRGREQVAAGSRVPRNSGYNLPLGGRELAFDVEEVQRLVAHVQSHRWSLRFQEPREGTLDDIAR